MIRRLQESDLQDVLALRREALENDPAAFSASPESDVGLDPDFMRVSLTDSSSQTVLGAFRDAALVGMTGVHRRKNEKERHKAVLWGMYVRPSSRRIGLGRALLSEAIRFATTLSGVTHLHLSVSESASAAESLYAAEGFITWGVEPASLVVGGRAVAVRHMTLDLTRRTL
jgi:ribosomal protein S18 acetylase RimI-like enzyme